MNKKEAIIWLKSIQRTSIFKEFEAIDIAIEALRERPKERGGEWIEHKYAEEYDELMQSNFECSYCHDWLREQTNYCPNCGAYMKGDKND